MNDKINSVFGRLNDKENGHLAMMSYAYAQLCVKADPIALLQIEVVQDGVSRNLEDFVFVFVHDQEGDDDKIDLFPKSGEECLTLVSEGVFRAYPEFKQSFETNELSSEEREQMQEGVNEIAGEDAENVDDIHFLRLTIPPVDDDRKKAIDDAVKTIHDATKVRMDADFEIAEGELAILTATSSPEDMKKNKDKFDKLKERYEELREKATDDKNKQVDEANKRYHLQQTQSQAQTAGGDDENEWKKLKVD